MNIDPALESQKADARLQLRRERALIEPGDAPLQLIERFPLELARLSPVAGYWPVGGEIDPRPLLAALAPGASPEAMARALAEPVAAFDRAVKEATEDA